MDRNASEARTATPMRPTDKTTLIPTRRNDVTRLDTIMSALGLAKHKKTHRVDVITYVLDEFEKNPPKEVSRFLRASAMGAGTR